MAAEQQEITALLARIADALEDCARAQWATLLHRVADGLIYSDDAVLVELGDLCNAVDAFKRARAASGGDADARP